MSIAEALGQLDDLEHEFSGGVSREEVVEASRQIGVRLPASYVEFLTSLGSGFIGFQELIGLGGADHLDVVKQTLYLRANSKISVFPPYLIPVLADGYGNYDCLDSSTEVTPGEYPVVQWLHDGGDDQPLAKLGSSYEDWLRALVEQVRRVVAADQ